MADMVGEFLVGHTPSMILYLDHHLSRGFGMRLWLKLCFDVILALLVGATTGFSHTHPQAPYLPLYGTACTPAVFIESLSTLDS